MADNYDLVKNRPMDDTCDLVKNNWTMDDNYDLVKIPVTWSRTGLWTIPVTWSRTTRQWMITMTWSRYL